jgi:hypothetical protein
MGKVGRIAIGVIPIGAVIGVGALQQAGTLSIPWWGWALIGWTGLSLVLGRLIGRWLSSVQLAEDELASLADSRAREHVRSTQGHAVVQHARPRVPTRDDSAGERTGRRRVPVTEAST